MTVSLQLGLAEGVCIGADSGSTVMTDYTPPFAYAGAVKKAPRLEVEAPGHREDAAGNDLQEQGHMTLLAEPTSASGWKRRWMR